VRGADASRTRSGHRHPPGPAAAGGAGDGAVAGSAACLAATVGRASVLALEHRHRPDHWSVASALASAALRLDLAMFKE
jgi:hypothetical protein